MILIDVRVESDAFASSGEAAPSAPKAPAATPPQALIKPLSRAIYVGSWTGEAKENR